MSHMVHNSDENASVSHHECGYTTQERLVHAHVVECTRDWNWHKAAYASGGGGGDLYSQNHKANFCSARLLFFCL